VRASLLRRYPTLAVRADLKDPHVYVFAPWTLQTLLPTLPQVSSVRLDLVPYLARRQFTLSKQLQQQDRAAHGISLGQLPADQIEHDVKVALHIFPEQEYVHRLNTVKSYLSVSLDPVAGALDSPKAADEVTSRDARNVKALVQDKKKGKSALATVSPFETVGERVHVSVDSCVGRRCSAGDRSSVKRSCIGENVTLGAGVKVNGSVVMDNVILHDGANLAGCVIGAGAVVGKGSVLKDCRVAFAMQVHDETQATGEDLAAEKPVTLDDFESS
jgi:translation initiation factor eIF-2B subunit gamma